MNYRTIREIRLRTWVLFGVLVLAAGAAFFVGVFPSGGGLKLSVQGRDEIKSGEAVFYTVLYENHTGRDITDAEVRLFFPKNVEVLRRGSVVVVEREDGWEAIEKVSLVRNGRQARASFGVKLFGLPGEETLLRAEFADGEGNVIREDSLPVRIVSTPLRVDLSLPARGFVGAEFDFSVSYFNESEFDIASSSAGLFQGVPNLELRVSYPQGFSFTGADMDPARADNVWFLSDVSSQTGGSFHVRGRFTSGEGASVAFRTEIGIRDTDGNFVVFAEAERSVSVSGEALTVFQTVNGVRDYTVTSGEELRWEVTWRNSLSSELRDVTVRVGLDSAAIDPASLSVQGGRYDAARRTVIWDKATTPALEVVRSGESGVFRFSVRTRPTPASNTAIISTADVLVASAPSFNFQDKLELKVLARTALSAYGAYHDTQFPNEGPVPPKVGQATTYTITFNLVHSSNAVKDARVKATLPQNVAFTGTFAPQGERVSFEPFSNQLVWALGDLEPGGSGGSVRNLSFTVSVVPGEEQVGKVAPLVTGISLDGFDAFSALPVHLESPDISTELPDDAGVGYTGGIIVE